MTHDQARTELVYQTMRGIFGDTIEVRKTGRKHFWFTAWGNLIRAWGVQEAMARSTSGGQTAPGRSWSRALEKTRGLAVEVIMKDISTVRYQPRRLWDWQKMTMEEVECFAPK